MARLYFFAEGQTEQTYADTVLKPHLSARQVYMQGPILVAHCRKKGRVHRGGGRKYVPMRNDILRFLKQEKGASVFFTTMIDLYGLHSDFPGLEQAERLRGDPQARVRSLEDSWSADINDERFIPFIQLHEFEALLFTDPSHLDSFYPNAASKIGRLTTIAGSFASPELINDHPATAPSKRLISEFPDYAGAKRIVGPQVAELIGLDGIRSQCPHFDNWLTRLEELGAR